MRSLAPILPHLTEDAFFHRGLTNESKFERQMESANFSLLKIM